ncbi:MAG: sigma 54-interacting transcriptional regulator [Flavonifractor plautii]
MKSAAVRCSAGSTRPTPPTTPLTPLWRSPRSAACRELASRLAQTDVTVLLQSESGTGKELYAQAIHNASPRSAGVFVAINCANFNANMLESELFGYTEGAFTGAKRGGKIGLFEAAAGGTLFLDEISEMDVGLQSKLLRALQERRIRPVGGVEEVKTDVRIIAACTADLPAMWRRAAPTCSTASTPSPSSAAAGAEKDILLSAQPAGRAVPQLKRRLG